MNHHYKRSTRTIVVAFSFVLFNYFYVHQFGNPSVTYDIGEDKTKNVIISKRHIPFCSPDLEQRKLGKTNCPNNDPWLNKFSNNAPAPTNIVVVGCNKGVDAVRLFAQYETAMEIHRLELWTSYLKLHLSQSQMKGACYQVVSNQELIKPNKTSELPQLYCIEPMPANIRLLNGAHAETIMHPNFKIMPYALGLSLFPSHVPFPDGEAGTEHLGISTGGETENGKMQLVNVSTVDHLFKNTTVEMLLIDTEGNDPLVLMGAARVLQTVSYLEFENHNVGEWKTYKLKTVIDYLDNLDFDCWWTTNGGNLVRITRCWHERYAMHKTWSNIACAKRYDDRWNVMNLHWISGTTYLLNTSSV